MKADKFRVIVAEDEKIIANNIAKNITKANESFEVISIAYDGLEAYELTKKMLPDLVVSDIKMPELDGLDLIMRIANEFPTIKTIIISGYSDFDFARSAIQCKASDYLIKPVNPFDLQKALNRLERELLAEKKAVVADREIRPADIVESITTYLRHNFDTKIDFSDLANQFGFSSAYLSKIFKEHTGTTASKYLNEYRINRAKKLLIDTDLTIKAISQKVGFIDPYHFSKNFKAVVGESPEQYRDNITNVN
jgi:Response regulator containing CheY-like receiver domain and AraC-type DNA-binding domain